MHSRTIIMIIEFNLCLGIRLAVYNMSSPFLISLPAPPDCHSNKNHSKITAEPVSLWNIDTSKMAGSCIILWTETYSTTCTTNFWGNSMEDLISSNLVPSSTPSISMMDNWFSTIELYETHSLDTESIYNCKWMSTLTKQTSKTWVKKSPLYYNSDGSLYAEGIEWKTKLNKNIYQTGLRYLYSPTHSDESCPPLLRQTYPGVIQNSDKYKFITVPQLQIQFSLVLSAPHIVCRLNQTLVYQTPEKYLISLDSRVNNSVNSSLISVNTDYSWTHILFDLNALEKMIESELELVEHEICIIRQIQWKQMFYSGNPSLIAQYYSGNQWASGSFIKGKIAIQIPKLVTSHCTYPNIRHINGTHMKVECETLGEVYISPWDNCLSSNPCNNITDYGFWFQSSSQLYINYISGEVQSSSRVNLISFPRFSEINLNRLTKYLQGLPLENNLIALDSNLATTRHIGVSVSDVKSFIEKCLKNMWLSLFMYIIILIMVIVSLKMLCKYSLSKQSRFY